MVEHGLNQLRWVLEVGVEHHDGIAASVIQAGCERGLVAGTIYSHLAESVEAGERLDLRRFVTADQQKEIEQAFARTGLGSLAALRESLGNRYDYGVLRIVRAAMSAGVR